jgi:hypothetical protein
LPGSAPSLKKTRHEGGALPFRVFDKIQRVAPGAIVENKRLGAALAFPRELQASYLPNIGGAIHDASGRQTIWRRRVCRRRGERRAVRLSRRRPEAEPDQGPIVTTACVSLRDEIVPPSWVTPAPWQGVGFQGIGRSTPMAGWRRRVPGAGRFAIDGLLPSRARLRTDDRSRSSPSSKCAALLSHDLGCHFYFARRVSFLSCADIPLAPALPAPDPRPQSPNHFPRHQPGKLDGSRSPNQVKPSRSA